MYSCDKNKCNKNRCCYKSRFKFQRSRSGKIWSFCIVIVVKRWILTNPLVSLFMTTFWDSLQILDISGGTTNIFLFSFLDMSSSFSNLYRYKPLENTIIILRKAVPSFFVPQMFCFFDKRKKVLPNAAGLTINYKNYILLQYSNRVGFWYPTFTCKEFYKIIIMKCLNRIAPKKFLGKFSLQTGTKYIAIFMCVSIYLFIVNRESSVFIHSK